MTRVVLDTNILLRLSVPEHPTRAVVADAVDWLHQNGQKPVLLPQIVYEFWAVATRMVAANGLGKTPDDADSLIDQFTRRFPVKRDERKVCHHWQAIARKYRVTGVNSHDMRIVAAMLRHGIPSLLTTNPRDFQRYAEIEVLTPEAVPPRFPG